MFSANEEEYILSSIKQIKKETHENNIMLRQLIKYFNKEIAFASQENENDFLRNILANMISSGLDISSLIRRR